MPGEPVHHTHTGQILTFGAYRLDLVKQQLWRSDQTIRLTGKAFGVLTHLASHPGQLVSKDELFQTVWPDAVVSDSTLTSSIKELRKAFHDNAKAPEYIETVHRRGYRFIAVIEEISSASTEEKSDRPPALHSRQTSQTEAPAQLPPIDTQPRISTTVGRETELAQLRVWLDIARAGERQVVFVTGEPGIGKTTIVETFLSQLGAQEHIWIGRGQCLEQHGAGEAYMPVLEALGRLCRGPQGSQVIPLLRQHAPTWLAQMPTVIPPDERDALQAEVQGVTRGRMLRELAEVLEVLTMDSLFILVLEDLHWSDASTIDVLASLARRPDAARLMVLGTYRPVEILANGHPLHGLVQELSGHRQCAELVLDVLNMEAIETYLNLRFPSATFPSHLSQMLYERTGGNPLFLVNTIEDLISSQALVETGGSWSPDVQLADLPQTIPVSLRRLVTKQMERLENPEREVLAAGSIAGTEFSVAAVAAALDTDIVEVEACSETLARRQAFLRRAGIAEWPDNTTAARYGFQHALYQELWYEQVPISQRQRWQLRIGERLEQAYGAQTQEIAAELALRFEQAGDADRALPYLRQAGENALNQNGHTEAITHLTKGISLMKTLPEEPGHTEQELGLQLLLGPTLLMTQGFLAPDVERVYQRVRDLCQQTGETRRLLPALVGLALFYSFRADYHTTHELAEHMLQLGESSDDFTPRMWGHMVLGSTLAMTGEFRSSPATSRNRYRPVYCSPHRSEQSCPAWHGFAFAAPHWFRSTRARYDRLYSVAFRLFLPGDAVDADGYCLRPESGSSVSYRDG